MCDHQPYGVEFPIPKEFAARFIAKRLLDAIYPCCIGTHRGGWLVEKWHNGCNWANSYELISVEWCETHDEQYTEWIMLDDDPNDPA